jgi:hypothetical protein
MRYHRPKGELQMTTQIVQGRYVADIRPQGSDFFVIVSREGQCLPGVPSKFFASAARADKGARRMLAKAGA